MSRLVKRRGQTILVLARSPEIEEIEGSYPHEIIEKSTPVKAFDGGEDYHIEVWSTVHLPEFIILGEN